MGSMADFPARRRKGFRAQRFIVAGPWLHGEWHSAKAESIGLYQYGGHDTAKEFREQIEAPFFRYYLHGAGDALAWQAKTFQTGSNTWHTYPSWPPPGAKSTNLYLHADGALTFDSPKSGEPYREYVSDPANPVPYRKRPISPTYPAAIGAPGKSTTSALSIIGPTC